MHSNEIREKFLDYFVGRNHVLIPGSPLVPTSDPTLLFTNAGMVQFKDIFQGIEQPGSSRACSVQKCLRVSGKHNDLEQVGPSARHNTFFEMLGNFSFGDYFKQDAIYYAWDLLTKEFQLPSERLWITVHVDDDESARIWEKVGVERSRILRFGDKENFWSMGDTGPCGPCSEIHYYQGANLREQKAEGVNAEDDYVEIWNLVFLQYNRDEQGVMTPLLRPSVDTGMGLERIAAVLQGVKSNYETDLFQPLIQRLMALSGRSHDHYQLYRSAYHAIVDHSRAITFLMSEGIWPGNGGRNYVLRRLIRRAAYLGETLGIQQPFLAHIVAATIDTMDQCYPELSNQKEQIMDRTSDEERRFQRTLASGLRQIEALIGQMSMQGITTLAGDDAFKLHDTYGFPLDLTQKILAERSLHVDIEGYEERRREQQQRSRGATFIRQRIS